MKGWNDDDAVIVLTLDSTTLPARRGLFRPLRRITDTGGTLGLVACVCLMLLATTARDLWLVHKNNVEQARVSTATTASLVSEQVDATLRTADSIVASLVERVEAEKLGPDSRNRLYRLMTSLAAALPAIHEMGITDRDGNAMVKSLVPDPRGLNYGERGYFAFHASHADRGPFIGARIRSKIDGSYNVTVTRRMDDWEGNFAGVVVASVSMKAFQRLFDQVQARSGGVVALLSEDGTVLARSPSSPENAGTPGNDDSQRLQHRPTGTEAFSDAFDGQRSLGSYRHLDRFPMAVVVSQSEWDVQRSWRQGLLSHCCILFGLFVVLVVLGSRELAARRALNALATQDGLTGLANRRHFDQTLECEFERATRSGEPVSLVVVDLDHFKAYNDHFGHLGGDECLRIAARAIRGVARRSGDLAARLGGEEFALLLPGTTGEQAYTMAEDARLAVQALGRSHSPRVGGVVTISAGVATAMPASGACGPTALVARADVALYEGKARGRNVVVLSTSDWPAA